LEFNADRICTQLGFCAVDTPALADDDTSMPQLTNFRRALPPRPKQIAPKRRVKDLNVLHVTDIHLDPDYVVGSNARCGEPICCRADDGPVLEAAGFWGNHACDLNDAMFESFLKQLSTLKPDVILWTGDSTPHDIWQQSREQTVTRLKAISDKFKRYLPNGTLLFPSIGNHVGKKKRRRKRGERKRGRKREREGREQETTFVHSAFSSLVLKGHISG
jgi:sphingomyelin phosphodiesterase